MSTHALLKEWHEKHWRDIENYGVTEDMAADFESACAAGPWRRDVDNAPRDGSEVLLAWANNGNVYTETLCWNEIDEVWRNEDEGVLIIPPFAFATINPPQVTT